MRSEGARRVRDRAEMKSRGHVNTVEQGQRDLARLSVLLAAALVAGCQPSRSDALASCLLDAERFYQTRAVTLESPRAKYIMGCIAAHGYRFDFLLAQCESSRPFISQPECYSD